MADESSSFFLFCCFFAFNEDNISKDRTSKIKSHQPAPNQHPCFSFFCCFSLLTNQRQHPKDQKPKSKATKHTHTQHQHTPNQRNTRRSVFLFFRFFVFSFFVVFLFFNNTKTTPENQTTKIKSQTMKGIKG